MRFFSDKTITAKPIEAGEILMRKMQFQFGERFCRKTSKAILIIFFFWSKENIVEPLRIPYILAELQMVDND